MKTNQTIIATAFENYSLSLQSYVSKRINNVEEAMDIVQDVFLRLLSYDVVAEDTIKSLCFTVANNLVIDHIRRHYKRQEVYSYAYDMQQKRQSLTPEQVACFHDIADKERCIMKELAPSTARVYEMSQMEEMSIEEISKTLNISRRTVECHQFKGRKIVREQLRKII